MPTNKELMNELDKSKQQTIDTIESSINSHKKLLDLLEKVMDDQSEILREYTHYMASDIIETYNKLMMLRTECIEKYINFYATLFQDHKEFDVSIPTKSLTNKKYTDLIAWQDELRPLKEFMELDENTSDEKADEILEKLKNI